MKYPAIGQQAESFLERLCCRSKQEVKTKLLCQENNRSFIIEKFSWPVKATGLFDPRLFDNSMNIPFNINNRLFVLNSEEE